MVMVFEKKSKEVVDQEVKNHLVKLNNQMKEDQQYYFGLVINKVVTKHEQLFFEK